MRPTDRIYAMPRDEIPDFCFDAQVAHVFPDMIERSVPGYHTVVELSGILASQYAKPHSHLYDLGCSLGATCLAMLRHVHCIGTRFIAVDASEAMIAAARQHMVSESTAAALELRCEDMRNTRLEKASVVVCNFALQFLPPEDRDGMLLRIRQSLLPGGALLLAEKVIAANASEEALLQRLHVGFKYANRYSETEIEQKRRALHRIMRPDSTGVLRRRLEQAGFVTSCCWFRCLNFVAFLAIAPRTPALNGVTNG